MPIGVLKDGQLYFVSSGQLGEPRRITDQSGQLVWSWEHDAFGKGEPDQQPAGASKDFVYNNRFPGQTYDAETGFFYNLNRYYDPNTGRYTRPDPIGLAGGMNPYVYVGGDPVNSIDPEGLLELTPSQQAWILNHPVLRAADDHPEIAYYLAGTGALFITCGVAAPAVDMAALRAVLLSAARSALKSGANLVDDIARTPIGRRGNPLNVIRGTNAPTSIGERQFTGHALDQMQSRGIMPTVVENAIQHGAKSAGNTVGTNVHLFDNVKVITNQAGNVITVIPK